MKEERLNKIRYHIQDRPRASDPIPETDLVHSLPNRRESVPTPIKTRRITSFGLAKRFEDPKLYQY
jgi:hypothetical protein